MTGEPPADSTERDVPRPGRYPPAPPGRAAQVARNVDFPVVLRGYDRAAVDQYVEEVNRTIAELEISSSPASAVRHALAEVSEETRALLQQAHETADEVTARSRSQADDRLQRAEREAEEVRAAAAKDAETARAAIAPELERMRSEAEARVEELTRSADAIAQERKRLIDNLAAISKQLARIAQTEAERFSDRPEEGATPTTELPDAQSESVEGTSTAP